MHTGVARTQLRVRWEEEEEGGENPLDAIRSSRRPSDHQVIINKNLKKRRRGRGKEWGGGRKPIIIRRSLVIFLLNKNTGVKTLFNVLYSVQVYSRRHYPFIFNRVSYPIIPPCTVHVLPFIYLRRAYNSLLCYTHKI